MTEVQANAIYDVLVEECGAREIDRNDFCIHILGGCREYRCCHALGTSGRFYRETMRCDYYCEDHTPERKTIKETANRKLAEIATP